MIESLQIGTSTLPTVGLGLWKVANTDAKDVVRGAIAAGYRHLDSACDYGNEVGWARAFRRP